MTPVTSLSGLPAGAAFNAGVQLEPDGLALFQVAQLSIEPVSAPAPGATIPLGWHSTGQGAYLNLVQPQTGKLTMLLTHFSGASVVTGDASVTARLINVANAIDRDQSNAGAALIMAHDEAVRGVDSSKDLQNALDILANAYGDIKAFMELALQSNDDDLLQCASSYALSYDRQRQILGNAANFPDANSQAITAFVQSAMSILQQHANDRCTKAHDPLAALDVIGFARQAQILGDAGAAGGTPDVSQCSPNPILSFQSELTEIYHAMMTSPAGSTSVDVSFDGQMSAHVTLTGTPPPSAQSPDGYASFKVTGSGPLKYDSLTFKDSNMSSSANGIEICTYTLLSNTGSTLTVQPNSEIKYQFTPKFQPQAVFGSNRQQLASFCPVNDKSPVSVSLLLDPGMPKENLSNACSGFLDRPATPVSTSEWQQTWTLFHPSGTAIGGWQIPGANSFAHIEFSQSKADSGRTLTEKTKLDLNQSQ